MWSIISKELFIYGYYLVVDTKRAFIHRVKDAHLISILDIENKEYCVKSFMRDLKINILINRNKTFL